ncbi:MAG: DUF4203 domain-containing protein [Candidatus Sulfobium sp.]|jgi:hypothetical protein
MFLVMRGQFPVFLQILLGIFVLFLGRKLFWLFVAAVGFVAGALLGDLFFHADSGWIVLIIAAVSGVLGALFAVLFQRLAIAVSGFLAGGYVSVVMLHHWGWGTDIHFWAPFLIGGFLGALLLSIIFDPALIVLSSLVGAAMIVQPFHLSPGETGLIFVLLALSGIVVQTVILKSRASRRRK